MSRILLTQVSRKILENNPKNLNINNYPNETAYTTSQALYQQIDAAKSITIIFCDF